AAADPALPLGVLDAHVAAIAMELAAVMLLHDRDVAGAAGRHREHAREREQPSQRHRPAIVSAVRDVGAPKALGAWRDRSGGASMEGDASGVRARVPADTAP